MKQKSKAHGISIFVKTNLFPSIFKIENTKSKCVLWVALGFTSQKIQLIVGGVYIPGSNSKFSDVNDYDIICEDIILLNTRYKCPFVLLGDFNSRTGKLDDLLLQNDAKQSLQNLGLDINRQNSDEKVDPYGRNLINLCNDLNFGILNGRFGCDKKTGQFTCIKTVGQSLVDYIIVSTPLFNSVKNFYVDQYDSCMSDVHLPVCATIKVENEFLKPNECVNVKYKNLEYRSVWKAEKKKDYQEAFSDSTILELTERLQNLAFSEDFSQEKIDAVASELTSILVEPAKQVGICKKYSKGKKSRKSPSKPWFNESCEEKRAQYFQAKNQIWSSKTVAEKNKCLKEMKNKGKSYKQFIAKIQKKS